MKPSKFTEENFYGQRFLDLSVLVDIEETEVEKDPIDSTTDEEGKPSEWNKTVIGTVQNVKAAENANTDPLVTDSDLITYNGLALYSYIMDVDSNKSTTGDQEYIQIYNYDTKNSISIRLTNNSVQDTKPHLSVLKYYLSILDIHEISYIWI